MIPFDKVLAKAEEYKPKISRFLRDMIAIPSESCEEGDVIRRIKAEMETCGFDRVEIDPMGNVLGFIGNGKHLIAMDAHIDTVGIGDRSWEFDPTRQGGRRADLPGAARATGRRHGLHGLRREDNQELGLPGDFTLMVTGTVPEEDCDGLCWQYIVEEDGHRPEFVVITEPTSCTSTAASAGEWR